MVTITLAHDGGWTPGATVKVADTPAADAAAATFLRRITVYTPGEPYIVDSLVEEDGTELGLCLEAHFFPTCEHGLSLQLCAGEGHYPSRANGHPEFD